jgi:hypothetical protein
VLEIRGVESLPGHTAVAVQGLAVRGTARTYSVSPDWVSR